MGTGPGDPLQNIDYSSSEPVPVPIFHSLLSPAMLLIFKTHRSEDYSVDSLGDERDQFTKSFE
jgi:hypothetical protein